MQKMIHKFQLNSINCATMPRGKIPAIWFCVPFSIVRIPCTENGFLGETRFLLMQKTKRGINNQSLITGFSIKFNINPNFLEKIDPPKGGKEKKREKIENEGKKGKKRKRVTESSQHRTPPENRS
jgi:hypothetical protein